MVNKSKRIYALPIVGLLLLGAAKKFLTHEFLSSDFFVKHEFAIAVGLVGFIGGLLVQDLLDRESWLWQKYRKWTKLFIIENVYLNPKNDTDNEWFELQLMLKFLSESEAAKITFECEEMLNVKHARKRLMLNTVTLPISKNQIDKRAIAVIPHKSSNGKPNVYACWGDKLRKSGDVDGMRGLAEGSENFLRITVSAGWKKQTEHVFIAYANPNWSHQGKIWFSHSGSDYLKIGPQNHAG